MIQICCHFSLHIKCMWCNRGFKSKVLISVILQFISGHLLQNDSNTFIQIQSLKRSTFPFLRSFTVRSPSVHRAFSVRSSCIHRLQFCVQRSSFSRVHRLQSVQRSLTVRSSIIHKAFIVHSAFSLHCHSEL